MNDNDDQIMLPPDPDAWDGGIESAFDDPDDAEDLDQEQIQLALLVDANAEQQVPGPAIAAHLSVHHDMAEFYSSPRVLPVARCRGLRGSLSLDITTGWDFNVQHLRQLSVELLCKLSIGIVILSPPCTAFSELQRLWNYKRMTLDAVQRQWEQGMVFVRHAMECALTQYKAGRRFGYEHPARASSWKTPEVSRVASLPGVHVVVFDQCMLGLKSPSGHPLRKRTKVMTNDAALATRLSHRMCDGSHAHQRIHSSEMGVKLSVWAQIYPPAMVELLAQ